MVKSISYFCAECYQMWKHLWVKGLYVENVLGNRGRMLLILFLFFKEAFKLKILS